MRWSIVLPFLILALALIAWAAFTLGGAIAPPIPEDFRWPPEAVRLRMMYTGGLQQIEQIRGNIGAAEAGGKFDLAEELRDELGRLEASVEGLRRRAREEYGREPEGLPAWDHGSTE